MFISGQPQEQPSVMGERMKGIAISAVLLGLDITGLVFAGMGGDRGIAIGSLTAIFMTAQGFLVDKAYDTKIIQRNAYMTLVFAILASPFIPAVKSWNGPVKEELSTYEQHQMRAQISDEQL